MLSYAHVKVTNAHKYIIEIFFYKSIFSYLHASHYICAGDSVCDIDLDFRHTLAHNR